MIDFLSKVCTGCMACVDICPKNAISSIINRKGHLYPFVDKCKCIECGLCLKICPVSPLKNKSSNINFESNPFAAWAKDDFIRKYSASGGIFAALASYIISQGGYVVGAALLDFEVKHIIINNISDLIKIQGSKYLQGDLSGIYNRIKEILDSNCFVLFSGTPCQVQALKAFLRKDYENLYTVDLLCGGFPSNLSLKKFREKYTDVCRIVSFRDKFHGWKSVGYQYNLRTEDKNGQIKCWGNENLPLMAFSSSMTDRTSCLNCRFANNHRISDLTIGDFWGDNKFVNQHYKGLSIVIAHSQKARGVLKESQVEYYEVSWKDAIKNNFVIINGRSFISYHFVSIIYPFLYKYLPYDILLNMYKGRGLLGFLYKLNIVLINKVSKRYKERMIKNFLNLYEKN